VIGSVSSSCVIPPANILNDFVDFISTISDTIAKEEEQGVTDRRCALPDRSDPSLYSNSKRGLTP